MMSTLFEVNNQTANTKRQLESKAIKEVVFARCEMSHYYHDIIQPSSQIEEEQLIFPGGGVMFWWQSGVVKALQERYDLLNKHNLTLSGASAGSISCVMAMCNVNMDHAMHVAVRLADEAGVFTRTGGLSGVWGGLIERWLEELLPDDCHVTCSGRVHISVTSLTVTFMPLHRHVIDTFYSKKDLIDACLTSVHIPYFIDGHFCRKYRDVNCLDGSALFFLHNTAWSTCTEFGENRSAIIFDQCRDKKLMAKNWGFLETISKDSFAEMFSLGYEYGLRWVKARNKILRPPTCLERVWASTGDVLGPDMHIFQYGLLREHMKRLERNEQRDLTPSHGQSVETSEAVRWSQQR
jgi:hypothetical protein